MLKKRSVYSQIEANNRKIIALIVFFPVALLLFVGAFFLALGFIVDPETRHDLLMLFRTVMPCLLILCVV